MPRTMKAVTMSVEDVLAQFEAWDSENTRKLYARHGAGDYQYGVTLGNLRGLAKKLKTSHALALQLWATGNADAMILATMLKAPDQLSVKDIERMIKPIAYFRLIDESQAQTGIDEPLPGGDRRPFPPIYPKVPGHRGASREV
jgi:3-methyladenine DNA glycosylase AlkD